MNLMKLVLAGALAVSMTACHEPGHRFCDVNDDGKTDVLCMFLVVGAKATVTAVAIHAAQSQSQVD